MGTLKVLRCSFAVVLALLASVASADVVDPAFNRFRSQVVGNSVQFSYGSGGTPLAGGTSSAGAAVSGGVDVSRGYALATKHGPIAGSLTQKVSNRAMAKAFGRAGAMLGGPVGLAFLALPAIVEWMDDAKVKRKADGSFTLTVATPGVRIDWRFNAISHSCNGAASAGALGACYAAAAGLTHTGTFPTGANTANIQFNSGAITYTATSQAVSPPGTADQPVSGTALEDALAAANPSPEVLAELYRLGEFHMPAHPVPDLVDTLRADFESRSRESVETSTSTSPSEEVTQARTCATYTQLSGSTVGLVEQCTTTTTTQPLDPATGAPVGDPIVETETSGNTTPDPNVKPVEEPRAEAVCGGPGLPSCSVKVDEAGTPTGETFGDSAGLDTALGNRDAGLATARDMAGDTGWGIVPSWLDDRACQPWDIFSLPDFIGGDVVTVDLCPIMPLAEGILNFIWVCVGMFAVTSMVASAITGRGT